MPMFSRLRRSLALFICPELGGNAPLGGGAKVKVENLGGADFDVSYDEALASWIVVIKPLGEATPVDPDATAAQTVLPRQPSVSKPWEDWRDQEEARVWLASASEAELGEMARHLRVGVPLSPALERVQRLAELGASSSEALWRRWLAAMEEETATRFRWPNPECAQGSHA